MVISWLMWSEIWKFCPEQNCWEWLITHWGWEQMAVILQTSLKLFSWMNLFVFWFNFHWHDSFKDSIVNKWALFQIMTSHWKGNKELSEPILVLFNDTYVTRIQWMNVVNDEIKLDIDKIIIMVLNPNSGMTQSLLIWCNMSLNRIQLNHSLSPH